MVNSSDFKPFFLTKVSFIDIRQDHMIDIDKPLYRALRGVSNTLTTLDIKSKGKKTKVSIHQIFLLCPKLTYLRLSVRLCFSMWRPSARLMHLHTIEINSAKIKPCAFAFLRCLLSAPKLQRLIIACSSSRKIFDRCFFASTFILVNAKTPHFVIR